jgi:hypothetical protein
MSSDPSCAVRRARIRPRRCASGGSLATTHESQEANLGLFAALLGCDADDELRRARSSITT